MKTNVIAIVPSAGLGKRFNPSAKKIFAHIAGIPVFIYTLKRLQEIKSITEIIPVLREEDFRKGLKLIKSYKINKVKQIARGGQERQDSVYNALCLIENNPPVPPFDKRGLRGDCKKGKKQNGCLILIHDGVRPLVFAELIKRLLNEIKGVNGVIPGLPVKETLKEINNRGYVLSTVKREKYWAIQTPQVFQYKIIKKAYDRAYKDGFYATDDAALVERIEGKIKIIAGSPFNIKITAPEDLKMAESFLNCRKSKKGVL